MPDSPEIRASTPPDSVALQEAALAHLARFAATEAALVRVLSRKVHRWAQGARLAGVDPGTITSSVRASLSTVREVVSRLAASGVVDDTAFAAARARRLHREGRSRRAIVAHLAARGVDADTAEAAFPEQDADELDAALAYARRRRIGPFRVGEPADAVLRLRELGALARAGFSREMALRALAMSADEAEAAVLRLKRS